LDGTDNAAPTGIQGYMILVDGRCKNDGWSNDGKQRDPCSLLFWL